MFATITYKTNTQKIHDGFKNALTPVILQDICMLVTGQPNYYLVEETESYNKGRLLFVDYRGKKTYVTVSELRNEGRNSAVQSVPTAINMYYADTSTNKELCYYFLPTTDNMFTRYLKLYYRLMKTAGIRFLNATQRIDAYTTIDDLIIERDSNRQRNTGNNSSFITKDATGVQIYGKVYGANKYESTILAIAASFITQGPITLFTITEGNLRRLPESSERTINAIGGIIMTEIAVPMLRGTFNTAGANLTQSLRSHLYTNNLLSTRGRKICQFCGCEIPEIVVGAHIYPVSDIRHDGSLTDSQKFDAATDGSNGLWLCENHHALFDDHILAIRGDGHLVIRDSLPTVQEDFIKEITKIETLPTPILTNDFMGYLNKRNLSVTMGSVKEFVH